MENLEMDIITFFKIFSDLSRIRIAGLLAEEARTLDQIAARVGLRPVEVLRHLEQFHKLNLLIEERGSYRLDGKALETLSRENLAHLRPPVSEHSNDESADDFDRTVVKNYSLPDGQLKDIPMQAKKLGAILRHVVQVFEPGSRYTEKEVNVALIKFHADTASLRRYLIDHHMLAREANGAVYWRTESSD